MVRNRSFRLQNQEGSRFRTRGAVGMRSRASGVARPQTVPALYAYSAFFVRCSRSMDVRRRTRRSASLPRHTRVHRLLRGPTPDARERKRCRGIAETLPHAIRLSRTEQKLELSLTESRRFALPRAWRGRDVLLMRVSLRRGARGPNGFCPGGTG